MHSHIGHKKTWRCVNSIFIIIIYMYSTEIHKLGTSGIMCIHPYMHTHDSRNMHENTHTWCYWDIVLAENVSLQASEWQHDTNLTRDWRESNFEKFYPYSTTKLYYRSVLPLECLSMPVKQLASMKIKKKIKNYISKQNEVWWKCELVPEPGSNKQPNCCTWWNSPTQTPLFLLGLGEHLCRLHNPPSSLYWHFQLFPLFWRTVPIYAWLTWLANRLCQFQSSMVLSPLPVTLRWTVRINHITKKN